MLKCSGWNQGLWLDKTTRNTRQTTEKPTKPPVVAADNKQCNCPPSVVTYIRWGNSTCPYGADTIYSGVVAGSASDHTGVAVDPLCLLPDPQYLQYLSGYQDHALLYGAKYKLHGSSPIITKPINVMFHVLCVRFMVILTR